MENKPKKHWILPVIIQALLLAIVYFAVAFLFHVRIETANGYGDIKIYFISLGIVYLIQVILIIRRYRK